MDNSCDVPCVNGLDLLLKIRDLVLVAIHLEAQGHLLVLEIVDLFSESLVLLCDFLQSIFLLMCHCHGETMAFLLQLHGLLFKRLNFVFKVLVFCVKGHLLL